MVLSFCHICDLGDISCCALLCLGIVRCIAFTCSVEMQIVEVYARNNCWEDVTKLNVLNLLLSSRYLYASSDSVIWAPLTTDEC